MSFFCIAKYTVVRVSLLSLCLGPGLIFADSLRELIDRADEVFRTSTFYGIFITESEAGLNVVRIDHSGTSGMERQRLELLNGTQATIWRDGPIVICNPGELQDPTHCVPFGISITPNWQRFARNYTLLAEEVGEVADREALGVRVRPRDSYRYGYLLFFDKETGILLKSLLLDSRQKALERFQFSFLKLGEAPLLEGEMPRDSHLADGPGSDPRGQRAAPDYNLTWKVGWLPPGFEPESGEGSKFSDGLAEVSVFVEPVLEGEIPQGVSRDGAMVAYMRAMQDNRHMVTVFGSIPLTAAERISRSVTLEPGPGP